MSKGEWRMTNDRRMQSTDSGVQECPFLEGSSEAVDVHDLAAAASGSERTRGLLAVDRGDSRPDHHLDVAADPPTSRGESERMASARPRARKEPPRGLRADAPEEIVRWEVQMQELARDLKAELDSKAIILGHLIREADRAARRLKRTGG